MSRILSLRLIHAMHALTSNNDVIYGGTALSGDDRLLRMRGNSAGLNGTGVSTGLIICVHTPVIQYGGAWRLPAPP